MRIGERMSVGKTILTVVKVAGDIVTLMHTGGPSLTDGFIYFRLSQEAFFENGGGELDPVENI